MKLGELLVDTYAIYSSTFEDGNAVAVVVSATSDEFGRELKAGIIVEILDEYEDVGVWDEGDRSDWQSPFPAYEFRFDGISYLSVHTNCFKIID